jgi:predicted nucleic acid-binding protein
MEATNGTIVLDTDLIIDYLRGVKEAHDVIENLKEQGAELATTAVNIFELAWGASKISPAKLKDIYKLSKTLKILPFSENEALKAGEEMGYLESIGMPVELRDVIIGTIARENGALIATGNARHFKRIRNLTVVEYKKQSR